MKLRKVFSEGLKGLLGITLCLFGGMVIVFILMAFDGHYSIAETQESQKVKDAFVNFIESGKESISVQELFKDIVKDNYDEVCLFYDRSSSDKTAAERIFGSYLSESGRSFDIEDKNYYGFIVFSAKDNFLVMPIFSPVYYSSARYLFKLPSINSTTARSRCVPSRSARFTITTVEGSSPPEKYLLFTSK